MGTTDDIIVFAALAGAGYFAYQTWFPGKSFDEILAEIDSKIKQSLGNLPQAGQLQARKQLPNVTGIGSGATGGTTTGNVGNYKVIGLVGDFDGNSSSSATVNNMSAKGVEFIVGLGDYAYSGAAKAWYDKIIGPKYAGKMKGALGNHDNDSYLQVFGQESWTFPYSIMKGVLACVFIDADSPTNAGEAEKAFIAAKNGHSKLICAMHQPVVTGKGHHPADEGGIGSWFTPLAQKYGVKAVFAGHNHTYERFSRNGMTWVTVGTGGRSQSGYSSAGGTGQLKIINGTFGFLRMAVGSNCLCQFISNSGGSVMDSFVI